MKAKLFVLYFLFFGVLALGIYAGFQFFLTREEVPEYEYDIPAPVQTPTAPDTPAEPDYDFAGLLAQNEDFLGWLSIPDTSIDFPVVHGYDNQYYLDHGFSGEYSIFGCPFLDTRTPLDGDNLVIHGHNMGNNRTEIFSTLLYFEDPEYAKAHNVLHFARPDREGREYTLFAVLNVNIYDQTAQYIRSTFDTEAERTAFLTTLQERSLYPSEGIPDGQILILSTCNRFYGGDNRLIVVAIES